MPEGAPPPRVALIGVSGYARIHLQFLEELAAAGKIALTAATVINPAEERAAVARLESGGARIYSDYRVMLAEQAGAVDLCCIPTGIHLHAPMTIDALAAGANVLVEKPLAPTSAEVAAIQSAEKAAARWVAVGFQHLYAEANRTLKRQILAGAFGRVRRIAVRGLWPRDSGYYRRNDWAGRIATDGRAVFDSPLSNAFSHFLNLALYFAGPAQEASASVQRAEGRLFRAQEIENFDTAALRFRTAGGIDILMYVSHSSAVSLEPEILIEGETAAVCWRSERDYRVERPGRPAEEVPLPDADQVRRIMFRAVVSRAAGGAAPICGTAVAAEHTRALERVQALAIETVPEAFRERHRASDGRQQACIVGLETHFAAAWKARALLDELPSSHDPQSFYSLGGSQPDRRVSAPP